MSSHLDVPFCFPPSQGKTKKRRNLCELCASAVNYFGKGYTGKKRSHRKTQRAQRGEHSFSFLVRGWKGKNALTHL
jgi:hypothetical protein